MANDIILELSEMIKLRDKLLTEIGQLYVTNYNVAKEDTSIPGINEKVLVFKKIEARLNEIEDEVIVMGIA